MNERGFLSRIRERGPIKGALIAAGAVGAGGIAVVSASIAESPIHPPTFDQSGNFVSRQVEKPPSETATTEVINTPTAFFETPTLTSTPEPTMTPTLVPTPTSTVISPESFQGVPLGEGIRLEEPSEEDLRKLREGTDDIEQEAWWEREIPVRVRIPQIGIDEGLIPMGTDPDPCPEEGGCELLTPDYGIGTPDEPLIRDSGTTVLVYAHSRWLDVPQPFKELTKMNVGDVFEIESASGEVSQFEVSELKLVTYGSPEADIFDTEDRAILQTSASTERVDENGNLLWFWLINEQEAISKATYKPDMIGGHMAWYVVADPIDQ